MKIFYLEAKNLNSQHWDASIYKGNVIVRAEDEKKARRKATLEFSIAVEKKSIAQPTAISPWSLGDHVDCKELNDAEYPIEGDEEILNPDPRDF
ncbi:MAG: hypothetical protein ACE5KZ_01205 [Candidatus Scalinduaceae bacterium]